MLDGLHIVSGSAVSGLMIHFKSCFNLI